MPPLPEDVVLVTTVRQLIDDLEAECAARGVDPAHADAWVPLPVERRRKNYDSAPEVFASRYERPAVTNALGQIVVGPA